MNQKNNETFIMQVWRQEGKLENDNKKCMRRCKKSKEVDVYKKGLYLESGYV